MTRFLVIQTAFLGDVILTTPLIRTLKKARPEARIDVLLTPRGADILDGMDEIDRVLPYDKRGQDRGLGGFLSQVKLLRRGSYDACLAPHRSARTAMLAFLSNSPMRVGFDSASLSVLYTHTVPRPASLHEIDRNMALLGPLGIVPNAADRAPVLPMTRRAEEEADAILSESGIGEGDLVVGVGPGSAWGTKRWIPSSYAAVCDALEVRYGAKVVLLGGEDDVPVAREVMAASRGHAVNLAGRTGMKQTVGIMRRCGLYIGNDSALIHVASSLRVPTVCIFGPTVPGQGFAPSHTRFVIVERRDLSCRPCSPHGPQTCPEGHFRCMGTISPPEVLRAAEGILARTPSSGPVRPVVGNGTTRDGTAGPASVL